MPPVFTRKVNAAKWQTSKGLVAGEVSADAVTSDLRTTDNELSFWACPSNDDAELQETVLALATGGDRLDKMDVAWIERQAVDAAQLTIRETPEHANTPVDSLRGRHVDVAKLDVTRLGTVAGLIHAAVTATKWKRFARKEVLAVVVAAIRGGRVNTDSLKDGLREAVEQALHSDEA